MRQLIISFILFTCACISSQAQVNYVLNPSFEQYSSCPTALDQIEYANYWNGIDSTWVLVILISGRFACRTTAIPVRIPASNSYVSVPFNTDFYQYPRTGNGMVQVRMLINTALKSGTADDRDYLQGRLYRPLTSGKNYCVTFYVNRC